MFLQYAKSKIIGEGVKFGIIKLIFLCDEEF